MYEVNINESESCATVILANALTVQNITAVKDTFSDIIKKYNRIVIDQQKAEEFDLSYLQFLISLKKSIEASGKTIEIITGNEKTFTDTMKSSGYNYEEILRQIIKTENSQG